MGFWVFFVLFFHSLRRVVCKTEDKLCNSLSLMFGKNVSVKVFLLEMMFNRGLIQVKRLIGK